MKDFRRRAFRLSKNPRFKNKTGILWQSGALIKSRRFFFALWEITSKRLYAGRFVFAKLASEIAAPQGAFCKIKYFLMTSRLKPSFFIFNA
jgi:hypothetical protein